jgi:ferredoxin
MNVEIEREECTSCAQCWDTCPEVFEENPGDGRSQITVPFQLEGDPAKGLVGSDHEECVLEAADGCPVAVIHVEE